MANRFAFSDADLDGLTFTEPAVLKYAPGQPHDRLGRFASGGAPQVDISDFDPNNPLPLAPRNAGGMTSDLWWAWEKGNDGTQYIELMRQQACRLTGLPIPPSIFDEGRWGHMYLQRGWSAPNEKATAGMVNAIANGPAQPELYRGLGNVKSPEMDALRAVNPGDTIDMPMASFTRSSGVATWYATDRSKSDETDAPVVVVLKSGASGVSVAAKTSYYPQDYETVVNGRFRVVANETIKTPYWSRSYADFRSSGETIVGNSSFKVNPETLSAVKSAVMGNLTADLSSFAGDGVKFTNDRRHYPNSNNPSYSVSVWQQQPPREFQVITLEQEEVFKVKDNG